MTELGHSLRCLWQQEFGQAYQDDPREEKVLTSPRGEELFTIVYSPFLEKWYQSDQGRARYQKPTCFFCDRHDEYNQLNKIATFEHLDICPNIKFVAPCHLLIFPFEHRSYPTSQDVISIHQLAKDTGLTILANFQGSGASYVEHVHFQAFDRKLPITKRPFHRIWGDHHLTIEQATYPIGAYRLMPTTQNGVVKIAHALTPASTNYNPLFVGNKIFIIPRTRSVPLNTQGNKFAAAEVFGTCFTRSRSCYDLYDYDLVVAALISVGLPSRSPRCHEFEAKLIRSLKESADEPTNTSL